jgi:hypothetical protein
MVNTGFHLCKFEKWWQGCKLFHPVFNGEDEIFSTNLFILTMGEAA